MDILLWIATWVVVALRLPGILLNSGGRPAIPDYEISPAEARSIQWQRRWGIPLLIADQLVVIGLLLPWHAWAWPVLTPVAALFAFLIDLAVRPPNPAAELVGLLSAAFALFVAIGRSAQLLSL
ncbi:hypothetical protein [Nocardia sp. NPDC127526]|uniref:hypothetical protein n=1 Tax=Nocardia sp. NPDC127526 TaxID=3345393 RepID=UPI0036416AB6